MTWTRKALKDSAKQELKKSFWHHVAVDLVAVLIMLAAIIPISLIFAIPLIAAGGYITAGVMAAYWIFFLVLMASVFLIDIPLAIGIISCFMKAPHGDKKLSNMFFAFRSGNYWPIVKAMFRVNIVVMLWTLLFIIPGYVKMYQYHMVPYILIENPGMSGKEAMRISREMTNGQKGNMFVLDLSFIGWALLAMLPYIILYTIGFISLEAGAVAIGILLVLLAVVVLIAALIVFGIYYQATFVQLYLVMREEAK